KPLPGDESQQLERVSGDGLVVLVVADHGPAGVGGEDLGPSEMTAREGALARAAGADEDDEAELGDGDRHRHASPLPKIAICVGGPTTASSGPTGTNLTE